MFSKKDTTKMWIGTAILGCVLTACGSVGDSGSSSSQSMAENNNSSSSGGTTSGGSTSGGGVVVNPPVGNGSYKVYSGCELPGTSFNRDIYVDMTNGVDAAGRGGMAAPYKTLSYLLNNKLIQAGDHIVIQSGNYGALSINQTNAPALVSSTVWTWFEFKSGAQLNGASLAQVSRVLFTGASISKATGDILYLNGTNQVIAADNSIYSSTANPNTLSIAQWMALANAVFVRDGTCNSIYRNQIRNTRHGILMNSTKLTYPGNSMKGLVEGNDLRGFSADASRGIGSDLAFLNNQFVDGYASMADGDANHDDMFQGYALNGAVFENLLIEGNYMLDRTTSTRSFTSDYQGISIFDGLYKNVVVRRNIVVTGAYHGVSMYGIDGVLIENNTLASTSGKTLWVGLFNSKNGVAPINNVVRNNLARTFSGMNLATSNTNNFVITNPVASYVSFDLATGVFDLNLKSTDAAYGKGAGAL